MFAARSTVHVRRPGATVTGLLLVSAVLGGASGVVLSLRHHHEAVEAQEAVLTGNAGAAPATLAVPSVDPRALKGIPPFPQATARPLFSAASMGGAPMAIGWFSTPKPVQAVLDYYGEFYRLLERPVVRHLYSERSGYVAWLETDLEKAPGRGVLHMVSALRQGAETIVLLSANDPLGLVQGPAQALPADLVMPPQASAPRVFRQQDEGRVTEHVTASVPGASLEAVRAFFLEHFAANGWVQAPGADVIDGMAVLMASRQGAQQTVLLSPRAGAVDVAITRGSAR